MDIIFFRETENLWDSASSFGTCLLRHSIIWEYHIFFPPFTKITKLKTLRLASIICPEETCTSSLQLFLVYNKVLYSRTGSLPRLKILCFMGNLTCPSQHWFWALNPPTLHPEHQQLHLWPCASNRRYKACVHHSLQWVSDSWWLGRRSALLTRQSQMSRKHHKKEL